jgi:hypothetical protein
MDLSCGDGHSGICWTGLRALLIRGSGVRIPPGALFRRSAGMCVAVPMVYRMPGHSFRPESDDPVTVEAGRMDAPHDVVRQRRPPPLNRIWTQALAWASMLRTRRKRGEGPRTGLSSAPAGERSAHGVGEHVGRVGVGWGKLPKLGLQRKQRPEDVGPGRRGLGSRPRSSREHRAPGACRTDPEVVLRPGRPAVVRVHDPVVGGQSVDQVNPPSSKRDSRIRSSLNGLSSCSCQVT